MRRSAAAALLALFAAIWSGSAIAAGPDHESGGDALFETLSAPRQTYGGLAVLPSGDLVVTVNTGRRAGVILNSIEIRAADGHLLRKLDLAPDPSCNRATDYRSGGIASDGRVVIVERCYRIGELNPTIRVLALDVATEALELLADPGHFYPPGRVSWSYAKGRGIGSEDSDLVAHAKWIDPIGVSPIAVRIPGRGGFRLDDSKANESDDCGDFGRARSPQFSPDGLSVALLAGPRATGAGGFDCLDSPWEVATFHTDDDTARVLARGFTYASGVSWSPDGSTIAVTAREGVYLVDARTGRKTRISREHRLGPPAWSPDGTALYSTQFGNGEKLKATLVRFKIPTDERQASN
jgi:hypothetical protein